MQNDGTRPLGPGIASRKHHLARPSPHPRLLEPALPVLVRLATADAAEHQRCRQGPRTASHPPATADSRGAPTYYAEQGVGCGYSKIRGLNVLLVVPSTPLAAPVITATRPRKGVTGSVREATSFATEALRTARACGTGGLLVLRADSATTTDPSRVEASDRTTTPQSSHCPKPDRTTPGRRRPHQRVPRSQLTTARRTGSDAVKPFWSSTGPVRAS